MPAIDLIEYKDYYKIITYKVSEKLDELLNKLKLNRSEKDKFESISQKKQKEFLGLKVCLKELNINQEVFYKEDKSPYLKDWNISISHSDDLVSVGISKSKIGIDIEKKRNEKILKIKSKFVREDELFFENVENNKDFLHIIWGIKESLFKINPNNDWSFLNNYKVEPFNLKDNHINCWILNKEICKKYLAYHKKIDDYYLVYIV